MTTKVTTGKVRLSYANIFEAKAMEGQEPKFSTMLLIPKTDKKTLTAIKNAVEAAKELGKSSKFNGKIPANLKTPLRDGDAEYPDDETYAGHYFLNASAKTKPGVFRPVGKLPDGRTKFDPIEDTTEVYSGCYAQVSINFYPYSVSGSKGIAAGLNHVVKVQDGDFLGGRSNVNDDFADVEFDVEVEIDDDDDFM